jgi:hypothetical protein
MEDADHVNGDSHWRIRNTTDPDTILPPAPFELRKRIIQQQEEDNGELNALKTQLAEANAKIKALEQEALELEIERDEWARRAAKWKQMLVELSKQ